MSFPLHKIFFGNFYVAKNHSFNFFTQNVPQGVPNMPTYQITNLLLGFQNGSDVKDVNIAFANLLTFFWYIFRATYGHSG